MGAVIQIGHDRTREGVVEKGGLLQLRSQDARLVTEKDAYPAGRHLFASQRSRR
jgi:hypothetical protein